MLTERDKSFCAKYGLDETEWADAITEMRALGLPQSRKVKARGEQVHYTAPASFEGIPMPSAKAGSDVKFPISGTLATEGADVVLRVTPASKSGKGKKWADLSNRERHALYFDDRPAFDALLRAHREAR